MFYIIKQVHNEPPGWKEDTQVLDKVATNGTMFIWLSFCMCTRRKPPRDLEIEHVSRTIPFVYSHMLNGSSLVNYIVEDPCIGTYSG